MAQPYAAQRQRLPECETLLAPRQPPAADGEIEQVPWATLVCMATPDPQPPARPCCSDGRTCSDGLCVAQSSDGLGRGVCGRLLLCMQAVVE